MSDSDWPVRPRVHFTAKEGWINDPLGLTFHDGVYHLFFQYVPGQTVWGPNCHWGHATSPDLLHWTQTTPALLPGEGDDGCWSGSLVVPDDGVARLFYTTVSVPDVQVGRVRVARPVDAGWSGWQKGPVVAELPAGIEAFVYRDPYVFRDGDAWRMIIGAGLADGTATAYVHTSADLETWTFDGELARRSAEEREPWWTGRVWECPQLFRLGDKHVLTVSVWQPFVPYYEAYAIGTYADGRFEAETWGRLSYGPAYYAGSTYLDEAGRRGLIYWLRGIAPLSGGWASANSVPHVLELHGDRLVAAPHPALSAARGDGRAIGDSEDGAAPAAATCDIEWVLEATDRAGLVVQNARIPGVLADLDVRDGVLTATTVAGAWQMPVEPGDVRVLVDGPVAEIFTTTGVMAVPIPAGETELAVHARHSTGRVFDIA
jgi:beta-fructofuranosidase